MCHEFFRLKFAWRFYENIYCRVEKLYLGIKAKR